MDAKHFTILDDATAQAVALKSKIEKMQPLEMLLSQPHNCIWIMNSTSISDDEYSLPISTGAHATVQKVNPLWWQGH